MDCGLYSVLAKKCRNSFLFFFFNDTATTEIYTLSLHDALPILLGAVEHTHVAAREQRILDRGFRAARRRVSRRGRMHPAAGLEVQPTLPDTLPRDTLRGGDAVAAPRSRGARGRGPLRLRRRRILSRIFR